MADAKTLSLSAEQIEEISLVDLAYLILKQTNTPFHFRDLMMEVARIKGLGEEQVNNVIARLYTEINIDGRFICIGPNTWGLKRWYPTDKTPEKATAAKKFSRKAAPVDEDDDFYDEEDDDDSFEDDLDDEKAYEDDDTDDDADGDDDDADLDEDGDDEDGKIEEDAEEEEIEEGDEDLDGYDEDEDEF
ncbi:MAG TPA: DNA-directed RNA polymerase subunit delta [Bacilli bacterium]|nr:DNA-directed RNA polymerase subunit delta [Bacilli bacterium]